MLLVTGVLNSCVMLLIKSLLSSAKQAFVKQGYDGVGKEAHCEQHREVRRRSRYPVGQRGSFADGEKYTAKFLATGLSGKYRIRCGSLGLGGFYIVAVYQRIVVGIVYTPSS